MALGLTVYAQRYLANASQVRAQVECPVLVWALKPLSTHEDELFFRTRSNAWDEPSESVGLPMVHDLRKAIDRPNPFADGVTVGRTPNNDIVLPHPSVSRFHAYFQLDAKTGNWSLVDAESKNGTLLNGVRLTATQPAPLGSEAKLRMGEVQAMFLTPKMFLRYLDQLTTGTHGAQ